MKHLNVNWV